MSKPSARMESIRPLEDFVCQAIPNLAAFPGGAPPAKGGRGRRTDMRLTEELQCSGAELPRAEGAPAPAGVPQPVGRNGGTPLTGSAREAELRSCPTEHLLALLQSSGAPLQPPELELIRDIARERLTRYTAEVNLASRLLADCQRCRQAETGDA